MILYLVASQFEKLFAPGKELDAFDPWNSRETHFDQAFFFLLRKERTPDRRLIRYLILKPEKVILWQLNSKARFYFLQKQ